MMKRYLLSIMLGFLAFANITQAQIEINFESETINTNGTVDIDVTANGFTDIAGIQFSIVWDSMVMTFDEVSFTNPDLTDLTEASFGTPEGAQNVDEGELSFSYSNPFGEGNLDDGDVFFTLRFDIVGEECDETTIDLSNQPLSISAFDGSFEELDVNSQEGTIMIDGSDCGGGGSDDLTFTAATQNAEEGSSFCLPISVENFIDIQTGAGTLLWDPAVIMYTGLMNIVPAGLGGSLNETNVANGELRFIWSNPDPGNPLTIQDGEAVFEICFDAIGSPGDMSDIILSTEGSLGFEWGNDDNDDLPLELNNGKVTITEMLSDPVILNVSDITIMDENAQNVCVDISVENFNDILSMQFVITWDATILSNAVPTNFELEGLNGSNFNIDGDCANFSWNVNSGIDLADGTEIFSMCFDYIGDCETSSIVDIVSKGNTDIEVLDGNTSILNTSVNSGSISLNCIDPVDCDVLTVQNTCVGELGGSITVDVPTNGCTYSWTNNAGEEVATTQNLLGVTAGTYTLAVTCDGEVVCTLPPTTIDDFPELDISGDVTNAGCGELLGAIDVTVTLGSGNYSYNWNPTQPNSPNIDELQAGPYLLTVTDNDNNCTATTQFMVVDEVETLSIASSQIMDESCVQNDGSISLTIEGGCEPYSFQWSDDSMINSPIRMNLSEGSYEVTVTDDSTPANTATGSFTIDPGTPLALASTPIVVPTSGSNGSVTIQIMGGVPGYSYNWSGPISVLPNSNSITGLIQGMYSVTVSDANNCEGQFGPYLVDTVIVTGTPELGNVRAQNNANGFSVICNGDMTGVIEGSIDGGALPMTLELTGEESRTITITNYGTFTIEELSAGLYDIEVSNSEGAVGVENIEIIEPDALESDVETGCDSQAQCDGFIDLNITGGFGDLVFDWGDSDLIGDSVDGLCQGPYTVITTDENGCERMDNINIESCEGPVDPDCYQVRNVITPNGDGVNDQFTVTCITDFPASLEIYDRWGKLVFNQEAYDGTWTGISNSNEELIEGGYMYIINIDFGQGNREIMKGALTLLRD